MRIPNIRSLGYIFYVHPGSLPATKSAGSMSDAQARRGVQHLARAKRDADLLTEHYGSDLPDLSVASNKRIAWIHSALLEVGSGSVSSSGTLAERTAACAAILHTRALEQRKGAKLSAGSSDGQSYAADAEVTETLSDTVVGEGRFSNLAIIFFRWVENTDYLTFCKPLINTLLFFLFKVSEFLPFSAIHF